MTLYELTAEYMQLLEIAEDPDTDVQVLLDTMEGVSGEIEEKADGYAKVMKELEAEEQKIKNEVDRLNVRRLSLSNNIRAMKLRLQESMKLTGKTKFKTDLFSFGIQKNPPSVVIDEQYLENLPQEYLIPQEPKVDKTKIKEDLKAGKDLTGIAHLEQGESLRIR